MLIVAMILHYSPLISDSCLPPKQSVRFEGPVAYPSLQQQLTLECIYASFFRSLFPVMVNPAAQTADRPFAAGSGERAKSREERRDVHRKTFDSIGFCKRENRKDIKEE